VGNAMGRIPSLRNGITSGLNADCIGHATPSYIRDRARLS